MKSNLPVTGFSHVTINVRDLATALRFYVDMLGMRLVHQGEHDGYLEWGAAWVCVQEQNLSQHAPRLGLDHVAFSIAERDFPVAVALLRNAHVSIVRGPIRRGVGWSVNFLDPDGTELELHTATLAERMHVWS